MKNSKKLIHTISIFITTIFVLICLFGGAVLTGVAVGTYDRFCSKEKCSVEMSDKVESSFVKEQVDNSIAHKSGKRCGRYIAKSLMSSIKTVNMEFKEDSKRDYFVYLLNILISVVFAILFLLECMLIFRRLNILNQYNQWFSISIYKSLKRLVYYFLAIFLIKFLVEGYYYFINSNILADNTMFPFIDYVYLVIKLSVVYCIAAVYKVGLDMHQEQELTI